MTDKFTPQELDSIERLQSLKPVPPRSPTHAERGKAVFLFQARQIYRPVSPGGFLRLNGWKRLLQRPRLRRSTLTISLLLAFLFLTASSTVYAAQQSLPGDQLYPVKLRIEDVRIALSNQSATALALHLDFAQERLVEMRLTSLPGDNPEILLLEENFQTHIQVALRLAGGDRDAQNRIQELIDEFDLLTGKQESDGSLDDLESPDITPQDLENLENLENQNQEETPEDQENSGEDSESQSSNSSEPDQSDKDQSDSEDDEPDPPEGGFDQEEEVEE